ncbi:MAG: endolytic transglycosylase MltG [Pseudomonadota bacterium]
MASLRKIGILAACIGFAATMALVALYLDVRQFARQPADGSAAPLTFEVKSGQGLRRISQRLADAGIVRDPAKFALLARLEGHTTAIQAGEYRLSAAMTPADILRDMVNGRVRLHRLTIPEGYTMRQIAATVAAAGYSTPAAFLDACRDSALLRSLDIAGDSCEGYLFPDTYYFPASATTFQIITAMAHRFWDSFPDAWRARAAALGMSVHEVVTLAAIIEKETGAPFERPLISSVFHNRLHRRIRLQTDPTVIYGITDFDGNLTRKHLKTPTPYNTYLIQGLPPGPIACPGAAALEAALYPADTDYLYFVSKQDRTHHFSVTIDEHNRAVARYQLHRR